MSRNPYLYWYPGVNGFQFLPVMFEVSEVALKMVKIDQEKVGVLIYLFKNTVKCQINAPA